MVMEGQHRNEKVMRYARMIDTEAQHTQHKSSHYYNTYGYFIDRETGLHFSDSIGDSLYRQFERDGNKPIEVLWPYSIDKREHTSIGFFYGLFGVIGLLVVIIIAGFLLAGEIKRIVKVRANGGH
jgi:hypothetical protein